MMVRWRGGVSTNNPSLEAANANKEDYGDWWPEPGQHTETHDDDDDGDKLLS